MLPSASKGSIGFPSGDAIGGMKSLESVQPIMLIILNEYEEYLTDISLIINKLVFNINSHDLMYN